jgi:hypothetical protein
VFVTVAEAVLVTVAVITVAVETVLVAVTVAGGCVVVKVVVLVVTVTVGTKEACNVTGLLGMLKVQGLLKHEIPDWVDQPENCQPELGVAVTVISEPTVSEIGPGPGLTEPEPLSTPVVKGCWTTVVVVDVVVVVVALQPAVRVPVPPTCNPELMLFGDMAERPPVVNQEENLKPGLGLNVI